MSYPKLIRLLMDREFRRAEAKRANRKAIAATSLPDLDREYTLSEIAIITRAAPARALGLTNKGHLGPGADADITIYDENADREAMFSAPRYVIKSGRLIISDHEFREDHIGRILHIAPEYDPAIVDSVRPFFENYYSIEFDNYAVGDDYLHDHEIVPTRARATATPGGN
jgi:formylmethanofuran dehydrogenase subunit A